MKKAILIAALSLMTTAALSLSMPDPRLSIQLPIGLSSNDSVHQLTVPSEMIAASRSAQLNDIVVTNAQGQTVPMAWIPVTNHVQQRTQSLKSYPLTRDVISNNDYTQIQLSNGNLNITQTQNTATNSPVIGALVDARQLSGDVYAVGMQLDMTTPVGQIVPLSIETSTDLRNWQPLAEAGVVQLPEQNNVASVQFAPTDLHGQYIRIRWPENIALDLANVVLITQTEQQAAAQPFELALVSNNVGGLWAVLPKVLSNQNVKLALRTQVNNSNVPINIVLKDNIQSAQQRPNAQTIVFHMTQNGQTVVNSPIALDLKNQEVLELSAPKGQQLPQDLKASVELPNRRLAFIASGSAPYVLRYKDDISETARPIVNLLPNYQAGDSDKLPVASIDARAVTLAFTSSDGASNLTPTSSVSHKSYWLWAILVGGVLLLAGMVLVVMKQLKNNR